MFINVIKSDLYKVRHSTFWIIHILVPILGVICMLFLSKYGSIDTYRKLVMCFSMIAIAFPTLIGCITSVIIDQEYGAGGLQHLLMIPSRRQAILSKIFIANIAGLLATVLSCTLFGYGLYFFGVNAEVPHAIFWQGAIILWLGNVALYNGHMFIALRFGKGASIGIGVVGSLFSALLRTGLGAGIWYLIPYGWAIRLSKDLINQVSSGQSFVNHSNEMMFAYILCFLFTLLSFLLLVLWFQKFERRQISE
ncbi:ABC-2 type transport system permease protein [Natranaerovirga hydrolytica]|uniref:ABC-2 type transport system permease protein n=1 Tax=Natranaerovirga hydrolytica TaxID=680378 RepID=A0A4V6NFC8_9FIRM|nr:lantibiotic immunity ABC transporter MutG family permease subunit [Natranaerovirga hydrolytica]TCK92591.1 ABC-2 type transport system permease protein [Natranaerovirga hydrolytica]